MNEEKLLDHFVKQTEKRFDRLEDKTETRFDRLESKLDSLLRFKWQIIGGSAVISLMITLLIQMFAKP